MLQELVKENLVRQQDLTWDIAAVVRLTPLTSAPKRSKAWRLRKELKHRLDFEEWVGQNMEELVAHGMTEKS